MSAKNCARCSLMSPAPAIGLFAFGLPYPGIDAIGFLSCGGSMFEYPSLTRISALRPSLRDPMCVMRARMAVIET